VQTNQGKAEYQRAVQQANQIRTLASAEAEKIARTGIAQAISTEEQVKAYGGPQYQVTQQVMGRFAEAIQQSKVDVVPRVVVGGGEKGSATNSSVMEGLLTMLLSEKLGEPVKTGKPGKIDPEADRLKKQIMKSIAENRAEEPAKPAAEAKKPKEAPAKAAEEPKK
jgi:hypothetical protein